MNAIENAQVCKSAIDAIGYGSGRLANVPGLIEKIIDTQAWLEREVRPGKIVRLRSLAELITTKPLDGWGEDPKKIEALLKDETLVLPKWREAMKQTPGPKDSSRNNVTETSKPTGNSKAYTLSRLKRESPQLFERVAAGELSANAAAIEAGFRKNPTPDEKALSAISKAENILIVAKAIVDRCEVGQLMVIKDMIEQRLQP